MLDDDPLSPDVDVKTGDDINAGDEDDKSVLSGSMSPDKDSKTGDVVVVPRPRFLGHTMDIWRVTSCLLTYLTVPCLCV